MRRFPPCPAPFIPPAERTVTPLWLDRRTLRTAAAFFAGAVGWRGFGRGLLVGGSLLCGPVALGMIALGVWGHALCGWTVADEPASPIATPALGARRRPTAAGPRGSNSSSGKSARCWPRRCLECHSGERAKGSLRLDTKAGVLAGGDTGPAIVPGKPAESLLVDAVNYGETYQMPPKSKLASEEVAVLTRWVELGAPGPRKPRRPRSAARSSIWPSGGRRIGPGSRSDRPRRRRSPAMPGHRRRSIDSFWPDWSVKGCSRPRRPIGACSCGGCTSI